MWPCGDVSLDVGTRPTESPVAMATRDPKVNVGRRGPRVSPGVVSRVNARAGGPARRGPKVSEAHKGCRVNAARPAQRGGLRRVYEGAAVVFRQCLRRSYRTSFKRRK